VTRFEHARNICDIELIEGVEDIGSTFDTLKQIVLLGL
jgi:hypothetical protein